HAEIAQASVNILLAGSRLCTRYLRIDPRRRRRRSPLLVSARPSPSDGGRISLGADVERGVRRDPPVPEARMIVTGDNRGRTLISLHRTPINEGIPHAPPTPHRRHPLVPRSVRGNRPARLE